MIRNPFENLLLEMSRKQAPKGEANSIVTTTGE